MPDGNSQRDLIFPRDIFGHRLGAFDVWPSHSWTGWDQFWLRVGDVRLLAGGSTSWVRHANALGSTTMVTDQAGNAQGDVTYYPWGQLWKGGGNNGDVFADLGFQINYPLPPSATRDFSSNFGRWLTPDPGGRKVVNLANPQTWNMYAYVTNNPTSLYDPSGLVPPACIYDIAVPCRVQQITPGQNAGQSENSAPGLVVMGNELFDAMAGAPGTYLALTQSGGLSFGFSVGQWFQEERAQEIAFENSLAYQQGIAGQYGTVSSDVATALRGWRRH